MCSSYLCCTIYSQEFYVFHGSVLSMLILKVQLYFVEGIGKKIVQSDSV